MGKGGGLRVKKKGRVKGAEKGFKGRVRDGEKSEGLRVGKRGRFKGQEKRGGEKGFKGWEKGEGRRGVRVGGKRDG